MCAAHQIPSVDQAILESQWASFKEKSRSGFAPVQAGCEPGDILLTYQKDLFHQLEAHDVVVVEKGRRTGFTWGVAAKAVLAAAASRRAGGMKVFYMGYNMEMAREFIDTSAMWARAFAVAAGKIDDEYVFEYDDERGEKRSVKAFRIAFASGFEIVALPSRPRSLRGMQGLVIIDEAAFHDDLEEVMKAALALLMWGGKVVVISTHNGEENYFNVLVTEAREHKKPRGHMRVDFGRALEEGLYHRICLVTGKTWSAEAERAWKRTIEAQYGAGAEEELYCIPRADSAVDVFMTRALVRAAIDRALPEGNPYPLLFGCDVARFGDDRSTIYFRRGPDARSLPALAFAKLSTVAFAHKIMEMRAVFNPAYVFVDGTGVGGGVVDVLHDLGCDNVIEVQFAARSTDKRYANKRTEMYAGIRDWLVSGCLPDNPQLVRELCIPKYKYTADAVILESKEEIKKRLGCSPDIADGLGLTFAMPVGPEDARDMRGDAPPRQGRYDVRNYNGRDIRKGGLYGNH